MTRFAASPSSWRVAIVLVTYNSAALLEDWFAALPGAVEGLGGHEVVVADNASSDGSPDVVAELCPGATVVRVGRNLGYAAGINAAIAAAGPHDAVLVVNPDIRLAPGSIARLGDALGEPGVGIAVPKVFGPGGELDHSLRREPSVLRALGEAVLGGRLAGRFPPLGDIERRAHVYERPTDAQAALGAVLLVSRACEEAVGAWDESFFLYSEEIDYCLRARDAGFAIRYVPDAEAVHLRGEAPTNLRLWSLLQYNRWAAFRRRHGRVESLLFRAALVLNAVLRAPRSPRARAALSALVVPGAGRRLAGAPAAPSADVPAYVCFAGLDWWYHSHAHADFQLMLRVARTRPVLLVNSIGMRVPRPGTTPMVGRRILRKVRSVAKLVRRPVDELPNFHVMTPLSIPVPGRPWARRLNAALVGLQVRAAMRLLGIRRSVCVVAIPTAWDVARSLPSERLVYNRYDKHSAFSEVSTAAVRSLEEELLRNADRVLYVSRRLMEEEARSAAGRQTFLDHGVEADHFRPRSDVPADIASIPAPRIGFIGAIRDYSTDLDLLERVAREVPGASLVLVGDAQCSLRRFDDLPNVHWLGPRPYADVPRYGSALDVALLPLQDNDFTRYQNPIKLKEYLALGLPVVTTDLPEAEPYADVLHIARDGDDFVARVRQALADGGPADPATRRAAVADETWDRRADELVTLAETSILVTR